MRRATRLWREITRPSRSLRFKQQSNRNDAGKDKMEIKIAFLALVILRRLHGRTVTDGLFPEKVTAQRSAAACLPLTNAIPHLSVAA